MNDIRPKIYKLPRKNEDKSRFYFSLGIFVICLAVLVVTIIPKLWLLFNDDKLSKKETANGASETDQPQSKSELGEASIVNKINIVTDKNGEIIGQIVQIPYENLSIYSKSKKDAKSQQELINIISRSN